MNIVSRNLSKLGLFNENQFFLPVNGERQWVSARNYSAQEIQKWLGLLRTQNGEAGAIRYRKMWHTEIPSIQGAWNPWTHRSPAQNLVVYPDIESATAIKLEPTATEKLIEIFKQQKIEAAESPKKAEWRQFHFFP